MHRTLFSLATLASLAATVLAADVSVKVPGIETRGGVMKLLIASDADEAHAYDSYKNQFASVVNYHSETTGSDSAARMADFRFAPMLEPDESCSTYRKKAEKAIAGGALFLLGQNEPNEGSMSATSAAKQWKNCIQPLLSKHKNVKGISPAMSGNPNAAQFLKTFKQNCKGCAVYAWSLHYYAKNGRSISNSISFLDGILKVVGKKSTLWLTETGMRDASESKQAAWIKAIVAYTRKHPQISVIAAFPHLKGADFVVNGKLSSVAKAWCTA